MAGIDGPERPAGRPRMKDLARRLGISAASVSLALRESARISPQTRERVRAAATEMGYVYNRGAANLRTQRTRIIGVVVPDIRNPAFVRVLRAMSRRLNDHGRMFFLCSTGDSVEQQAFFLKALSEYGADGMLVCPAEGTPTESLPLAIAGGLPTVCFFRHPPAAKIDSVGADDFEGFRRGTVHLLALGHRRIALVGGGADTSTARNRKAGYQAAMAEAGVACDAALQIACSTDQAGGFAAVQTALEANPPATAAICFGDVIAFGFMHGLRRRGIEPGRDFAVVGCDGVDEAELWHPRLTTLVQAAEETGERAVELLLRRIEDPGRKAEHVILPLHLRIRESCGAVATDDGGASYR